VFNTFGWDTLFGIYAIAFLLAMTTWIVINPLKRFYDGTKVGVSLTQSH
jgi:hypothetical protein